MTDFRFTPKHSEPFIIQGLASQRLFTTAEQAHSIVTQYLGASIVAPQPLAERVDKVIRVQGADDKYLTAIAHCSAEERNKSWIHRKGWMGHGCWSPLAEIAAGPRTAKAKIFTSRRGVGWEKIV